MSILAIRRARLYSPGHEGHDWRVLSESAERLALGGHALRFTTEEQVTEEWVAGELPGADLVLNMCQGPLANGRLLAAEARGVQLVNRPSAALGCLRHRLLPKLRAARLPTPEFELVDTSAGVPERWTRRGRLWIKRADVHSTGPGDVVAVEGAAAEEALGAFRDRGQERAVLQQHLEGAVVKFYGVGGRVLHALVTSGDPATRFDRRLLEQRARQCAAVLGLEIYGGECVVTADGTLPVIDVNDWPSFAPCRPAAVHAIAAHLLERIEVPA